MKAHQTRPPLHPMLSVKFAELSKLFNHLPAEQRTLIEHQLREVLNVINVAMTTNQE